MSDSVLSELVVKVIRSGTKQSLDEAERNTFYREFESTISKEVEDRRERMRRAYEDARNIAIR